MARTRVPGDRRASLRTPACYADHVERRPLRIRVAALAAPAFALAVLLLQPAVGCGSSEPATADGTDAAEVSADAARAPSDAGDGGMLADAADAAFDVGFSVVQHHNHASRDGVFVDPAFTRAAAARLVIDPVFQPPDTVGQIDAQPLFVESGPGGKETLLVVTEANEVVALDAVTGAAIWKRVLATPADDVPCVGVRPLGILGTPYVDLVRRTIYLDSVHGTGNGTNPIASHFMHALSLDDGAERSGGWPVDVQAAADRGYAFHPQFQNQRGGLALVNGVVYASYGAHAGDCGDYHGWVVGVQVDEPHLVTGFATRDGSGCGIWGTPGVTSDGTNLFVTTANGSGADTWGNSEAVLRLSAGPYFSGGTKDFFAPSNWREMDGTLKDLGAAGAVLVDVPGATPSALVAAGGKGGVVYLLDRQNLGGFGKGDGTLGEGIASDKLHDGSIVGAPATYRTNGATYVVVHGLGYAATAKCPTPDIANVIAYRISGTSPPAITPAWCAYDLGEGSPSVTTTNAQGDDAIVWVLGTESSNRLFGFDGVTGAMVFDGGPDESTHMTRIPRFAVPIAARGRIFVGAERRPYAFRPQ